MAKVLPGEYYVSRQDEIISTVLGSCVAACVRDPVTKVGGMNHFMLPGESNRNGGWGGEGGLVTRYGIAAMENLINDILKQGSEKSRLEFKLFGGGAVLAMEQNNIGDRNIAFVRDFIETEGFQVLAEDLGGPHPRKVNYYPATGRVMVRKLRSLQSRVVADKENAYRANIQRKESPGEIELFS